MTDLHVSKKNIKKLFGEMQKAKFIIPDYQRPYKWDIEKCEILWDDFVNFSEVESQNDIEYFLGTIVSCSDNEKNKEIIDGQQRITTIMLLLRAFYKKLEKMPDNDEDVIGLKGQISPCIWNINSISQKITDYKDIHILSCVATELDNNTFHSILETGTTDPNSKDRYSQNYNFFQKKCDDYATNQPMLWKQLCVTILDRCVILPIECNDQDSALTIFSTLNDRGLPLEDSDIFKAKIYKNCKNDEERNIFTEKWKYLTQICNDGLISIDDAFRYYTHVIRAKNKDKSKEIALRKFYMKNDILLKNECLLLEIIDLAIFWKYINTNQKSEELESLNISEETKQFIHCLKNYPNEFWKYALSVFFIKNKNSDSFDENLLKITKQLTAFLFIKFIQKPTVNAIKDDIYASCISIQNNNTLNFKIDYDYDQINNLISTFSSSKIAKSLLLLTAYLHPKQNHLISNDFEIEHIFPKKWQNTNYNGWTKIDAENFLENFGNKIIFEKKLNIQAGNNYFLQKKEKYKKSKIKTVIDLANITNNDWTKENIEERELALKKIISNFFKSQIEQSQPHTSIS